jgi:hypothetical protein
MSAGTSGEPLALPKSSRLVTKHPPRRRVSSLGAASARVRADEAWSCLKQSTIPTRRDEQRIRPAARHGQGTVWVTPLDELPLLAPERAGLRQIAHTRSDRGVGRAVNRRSGETRLAGPVVLPRGSQRSDEVERPPPVWRRRTLWRPDGHVIPPDSGSASLRVTSWDAPKSSTTLSSNRTSCGIVSTR